MRNISKAANTSGRLNSRPLGISLDDTVFLRGRRRLLLTLQLGSLCGRPGSAIKGRFFDGRVDELLSFFILIFCEKARFVGSRFLIGIRIIDRGWMVGGGRGWSAWLERGAPLLDFAHFVVRVVVISVSLFPTRLAGVHVGVAQRREVAKIGIVEITVVVDVDFLECHFGRLCEGGVGWGRGVGRVEETRDVGFAR